MRVLFIGAVEFSDRALAKLIECGAASGYHAADAFELLRECR
jgi:methionyl-tRNA formyltransferase